jgi:abhydrolase domain-containing protein 6
MQSDQEQTNPSEEAPKGRIRRGKGLQLSVHDVDAAERREPEVPEDADPGPARRGKGIALSVQTEAESQPSPDAAARPVASADPPPVVLSRPEGAAARSVGLAYRHAGQRAPLLLLHGWSNSSLVWEATMKSLSDLRHSYALDLPGFGETQAPNGMPDIATLAETVLDFADSRDFNHFDLVGHSFGAMVAAQIAAKHPDRVKQLVLTSLGVEVQSFDRPALMMARSSFDLSFELMRPWLLVWRPWAKVFAQYPPLPQFMALWLLQHQPGAQTWRTIVGDMAGADPRGFLAYRSGLSDPAFHEVLRTISVPTLLLAGQDDRLCVSASIAAAQQQIPESQVQMFANCGHLPMFEQPEAYTHALRDFLGAGA